jgi:hypothetical protein
MRRRLGPHLHFHAAARRDDRPGRNRGTRGQEHQGTGARVRARDVRRARLRKGAGEDRQGHRSPEPRITSGETRLDATRMLQSFHRKSAERKSIADRTLRRGDRHENHDPRQRHAPRTLGGLAPHPAGRSPRHARSDRHEEGVRSGRVRSLHGHHRPASVSCPV